MHTMRDESAGGHGVTTIVPSIVGWQSYRRSLANLLLFGLAVFGGEWLVHEVEYVIEYRWAFSAIMATSPHHVYMTPLGLLLGALVCAFLVAIGFELCTAHRARQSLLRSIPRRLARHAHALSVEAPDSPIRLTYAALASLQVLLYVVQENLESVAMSRGWPGLWVLLAPQHATVIPLHLLAAACSVLILRSLSARVNRARNDVRVARLLAGIVARSTTSSAVPLPAWLHIPAVRILIGGRGLRSPPLAV